jgi:integrase
MDNSKYPLIRELNKILSLRNRYDAKGRKVASSETQRKRRSVLTHDVLAIAKRFNLKKFANLKARHINYILNLYDENEYSEGTIANNVTIWRTFLFWVGKGGLIDNKDGVNLDKSKYRRVRAAQIDKSWTDDQLLEKLRAVQEEEPRIAIILLLQALFGLRIKEAIMLQPKRANSNVCLDILKGRGAKGNRVRQIPIENGAQREALKLAETFICSSSGSMIPEHYELKAWMNHVYYILRKHNVDRKNGLTTHGLRAGYAMEVYEAFTCGGVPPIRRTGSEKMVDPHLHDLAKRDIAERLGHARPSSADAYIGSRNDHNKPKKPLK